VSDKVSDKVSGEASDGRKERLPHRRSGCCFDDRHPTLHAICSGRFEYRRNPFSSPEPHQCSCPCHTPAGSHLRQVRAVPDAPEAAGAPA